jgi:hypothetical protein
MNGTVPYRTVFAEELRVRRLPNRRITLSRHTNYSSRREPPCGVGMILSFAAQGSFNKAAD